ncbi:hypothetical protein [Reyranella sp.]|uniref:hypothetical protein n=1 Tax=Reyranella sp. TaxID=1929291 RepID=UPI0027220034|nr:hypothetical protein [Reyranella sp.]MDO8977584.1 hypothetical protein [Reyranella sp.]
MGTVTSFIRNTPKTSLRAYFDQADIRLTPPVNWDGPGDVVRPILQAVDEMDPVTRDRLETVAERVTGMADEAGEAAIYSIAQDPALRIPTKRATDSERRRPSIPIDGGQGFR